MAPDFFSEIDIDFEQVKVLCHAMMDVARVDGVHENEMQMVREFYASCARSGDPAVEAVTEGAFDPTAAAGVFGGSDELRSVYVKSLILLAYADGDYGDAERARIQELAGAVDLDAEAVGRLETATREYLMASLSHIQNLDALREVQKELG